MLLARFFLPLLFATFLCATCPAQLTTPPTPLVLGDNLPAVQVAPDSTISDPQCDADGTVYLRHESAEGGSWDFMKVASDGSTQHANVAAVPGIRDMHTFAAAVGEDGSLQEIVRAWGDGHDSNDPSVYYLQFDSDGSFRSRQRFWQELVPAMLVRLPTGDFFAAGVIVKKQRGMQDLEEVPLAGIFDSDAQLRSQLGAAPAKLQRISANNSEDRSGTADALQQGGFARLGDDGDLYILLNSGSTRVQVFRQTGEFRREMKLRQPFQEGLATGLWISSGRMLVSYEGEADDPREATTYILYDAGTGELIRAYRPQFTGIVACFENGESLTVLVKEQRSGRLSIGSMELQ